MTVMLLVAVLGSVLLLAAFGGPWLIRQAAPALAAVPRFAATTIAAAALIWMAALLALGPLVAWMSRGPAWLPADAAEVCGRCLAAATPFGESLVPVAIPAVLPLAFPLIGAASVAAGLWREFAQLRRARRRLAERLNGVSCEVVMLGHRVSVVAEDGCFAFSLPRPLGGIVLSRGAVACLTPAELAAVLQHEDAHLKQRHHLFHALLNGATHYFRRVPLIQAVRSAAPHYLEIAADQAAKRETGTAALASALLKLGATTGVVESSGVPTAAVLHAAGSERVRMLIGEPHPPASVALAIAAAAYAVMLLAVIVSVHAPYFAAVVAVC